MTTHGRLNRAWCELPEVATVPTRRRNGDGTVPSYLGLGGLISSEVTPMAVTAEMVTVTLPKHERRSWEVEKVEEDTAELW